MSNNLFWFLCFIVLHGFLCYMAGDTHREKYPPIPRLVMGLLILACVIAMVLLFLGCIGRP